MITNHFEYQELVDAVIETRKIILKYFRSKVTTTKKSDNSPLTEADVEVNNLLIDTIKKYYPNAAVISEENSIADNCSAILKDQVFIIDPIDGTNSFIHGSVEFSVNIALREKDKLVMGIIYSPIEDILYYAEHGTLFKFEHASEDHGKISKIRHPKKSKHSYLTVITTRRKDEIEKIKKELVHMPKKLHFISLSSSLKFCYLVEGAADIYYRTAKIRLWDIAAGFAIVDSVGLKIYDKQNKNLLSRLFSKEYIKTIVEDDFKVDSFVIR